MFEYFYNEILRKTIIGFGTLFNGITIKQDGSVVKVPFDIWPNTEIFSKIRTSTKLKSSNSD